MNDALLMKPALNRKGIPYPCYVVSRDGRVGSFRRGMFTMLKQPNRNEYRTIVLYQDGGKFQAETIHALVARSWIGMPPSEDMQVNHLDGVKSNNSADNLEWTTAKQNTEHSLKVGLHPHGERTYNHKLTVDAVLRIRSVYAAGSHTQRGLAKEYGVSQRAIGMVIGAHRWKSVSAVPVIPHFPNGRKGYRGPK